MKISRITSLFTIALVISHPSWASVYKCTDTQGNITYTNQVKNIKQCEPLGTDLPVSSISSPRIKSFSAATVNSKNFPVVSKQAQKNLDQTRKQILQKELEQEQRALEETSQQLKEQESVRMGDERNYQKVLDRLQPYKDKVMHHQQNVDDLKEEIRRLK